MYHDRYGLELTTHSAAAATAYGDGVDRMLASRGGVVDSLNEAVEADPDFALPHLALARVHQMAGHRPEAMAEIDRASDLVKAATRREQDNVAIQRLLLNGAACEALARIKDHVVHHPLDAMALAPASSVFGVIGFSGRVDREAEQLALLAPLADHYGDDWWFLAVHGFALVETGRWAEGRELIERSLDLNPDSGHAAHARAHALYESGDDDVALPFLADWLPGYDRDASLHCHLWWHCCLLLIAEGDSEQAWSVYEQNIAPDASVSPPLNVITDGISLLWRAKLADNEVDENRWRRLHRFYHQRFDGPATFLDAHASLPMVALELFDEYDEYVAAVERLDASGALAAGAMAVVMAKAFRAYAEGRWSEVIDLLEPHLDRVVCIGGSRAQRDLALNTVLAAYGRDGRWPEAEALMGTITDRHPTHPVGRPSN